MNGCHCGVGECGGDEGSRAHLVILFTTGVLCCCCHLLFCLDIITSTEAWLPNTDTDMNIIYLAEACNINTGEGCIINYQSLHYTFDDRVKFSAQKFYGAGG